MKDKQKRKTPKRELGVMCKYCGCMFTADERKDLIPSKTIGIFHRVKYTFSCCCPVCNSIFTVPSESVSKATREQVQYLYD